MEEREWGIGKYGREIFFPFSPQHGGEGLGVRGRKNKSVL